MLEFFRKKNKEKSSALLKLAAPATGKSIPLSEVPDPVFAEKMIGDGVAIILEDDIVVAPADGELTLILDTKHAFAMTLDNGIEILVHIGLETVTLKGEGFEQLVQAGIKVKAGTPIMKLDRKLIESKGFSLITPVLITNVDNIVSISNKENIDVVAGKTVILEYSIK